MLSLLPMCLGKNLRWRAPDCLFHYIPAVRWVSGGLSVLRNGWLGSFLAYAHTMGICHGVMEYPSELRWRKISWGGITELELDIIIFIPTVTPSFKTLTRKRRIPTYVFLLDIDLMPSYCLQDCHYFYRTALRGLNISTSVSPLYT